MLGSPEDEGVCSEADVCVRERDGEKEKKEGMARVHESGGGFMWGGSNWSTKSVPVYESQHGRLAPCDERDTAQEQNDSAPECVK